MEGVIRSGVNSGGASRLVAGYTKENDGHGEMVFYIIHRTYYAFILLLEKYIPGYLS